MVNDIDLNSLKSKEDLSTFITCLEQSVKRLSRWTLTYTDEENQRERNRQPWFTTEIKTQKQRTRRREKIWCRHHEEHQWTAYQELLKEYKPVSKFNFDNIKHFSGEHLKNFHLMTEEELLKIMNNMLTESCKLDPLAAKIIKEVTPKIIQYIIRLTNTSLREGCFVDTWKMAIDLPLLKNTGLVLIFNKYRPVSNLSFLSNSMKNVWYHNYSENGLIPDYLLA